MTCYQLYFCRMGKLRLDSHLPRASQLERDAPGRGGSSPAVVKVTQPPTAPLSYPVTVLPCYFTDLRSKVRGLPD